MPAEKKWKELYQIGGICLLIDGILLILAFSASFSVPESVAAEDALRQIAQNGLLYRTITGIFTAAAIIFTPAILALYLSLREIQRTRMLIAATLFTMAIALFLGSSVVQYSLARLSADYVTATSEAERAAYVVAWKLVNDTSVAAEALAGLVFAVSVLLVGSVMMKGPYGKPVAYLSIITGIVGIVAIVGLPLDLISSYLTAVWLLAVGYKLYKQS